MPEEEFEDITDYAFNVRPTLDVIIPDRNPQFYVFNNRIYTNTELSSYEDEQISLSYFYTITDLKVHGSLNTNSSNYSSYTPIVDYYMLKLTGQ